MDTQPKNPIAFRHGSCQQYIIVRSETVYPETTITDCRDPKDNKFLEVALEAKVEALITGDKDLLALHPFRGIPILTPRQFLELED